MNNLVPFGEYRGRLYTVEEVARGIECGCFCPDPKCSRPLVARKGTVMVWHFAHAGDQDGPSCSGGESGLHRYAKQVLCEAVDKVVQLPYKNNRDFYGGYYAMLRVSSATQEALIPGTSRRCDVLLYGTVRKADGKAAWNTKTSLAVEIAVTHFKDVVYRDEIRKASLISVLEVPLSWDQVRVEAERLGKQYHEVVRHILLNQSDSKNWILKLGGEAWVCPNCGGYKEKQDRVMCYECLAKRSTRPSH